MQEGNFNIGGAPTGMVTEGPAHQPVGGNGRAMTPDTGQPIEQPQWPTFSPGAQPQQQVASPQNPAAPQSQQLGLPFDQAQQAQTQAPQQYDDGLRLAGPVGGYQTPAPQVQQPVPQMPQVMPPPQQPAPVQPAHQPQAFPTAQQTQQPQQFQATIPFTTNVRDSLVQQGYPVASYQNDAQLLQDIGSASNEATELRRLADIGRQALSGQQPIQPAQPPALAPPSSAAQPQSEEPWNDEWGALLEIDSASGAYVPKKGNEYVASGIAQVANRRQARQRERAESLINNPLKYLNEQGLSKQFDALEDRVMAQIEQRDLDRTATRQASQFYEQHNNLLQQVQPDGSPAVNPFNGQSIPTPLGQAVEQRKAQYTAEFIAQYGVEPDDWLLHDAVRPMIESAAQQQVPASQQQQVPAPQQQQFQFAQPQQQFAQPPAVVPRQVYPQQQPTAQQSRGPGQAVQPAGLIGQAVQQTAMWAPPLGGTIANAANHADIPQDPTLNFQESLRASAIQRGVASPDAFH